MTASLLEFLTADGQLVWAWPWALAMLPLPLLVHWFVPARSSATSGALRVPSLTTFDSSLSLDGTLSWRSRLGRVLLAIAWLALIMALARPQSFGEPVSEPVSDRDLMLRIDISPSMRESDLYAGGTRATRIAVVREVARDFVARRTGDRIGLIMFGEKAYVQTPLTTDHATVDHFLEQAAIGLAGESTAIGDAIGLAVKRLRDRDGESRVLILLTDGANSAGAVSPRDAAQLAAASGIRIHTIGVGADARDDSLFGRAFGRRAAQLDEPTLIAVAEATGGRYFRARDARELQSIYREIDLLEPNLVASEQFRPLRELHVWPLGLALLLSVCWALLQRRGEHA